MLHFGASKPGVRAHHLDSGLTTFFGEGAGGKTVAKRRSLLKPRSLFSTKDRQNVKLHYCGSLLGLQ